MPRKKLKQTKKVSTSRIQPLIDKLTGVEDPDDLMIEIMEVLPETVDSTEVEVGNFCTFVYQPKTPFIKYDQNPLVAVVAKYNWGFRGINYHWGSYRNYTNEEVIGSIHLVNSSEVSDLRSIPYQNYRLNI
jgi:hypothetical protein